MISRREFVLFALMAGGTCSLPSKAFAAESYETLTDSFGRTRVFDEPLQMIAPLGAFAQSVIYSINPNMLASSRDALLGEYQGSSPQNLDVAAFANENRAPLALDLGVQRKSSEIVLNNLEASNTSQSLFLDASFTRLPECYRAIGRLTQDSKCETMASYLDKVVNAVMSRQDAITASPRKRIFIACGNTGLAAESFNYLQENVFDYLNCECVNNEMIGNLVAEDDLPLLFTPDEVNDEQVDVILFKDFDASVFDKREAQWMLWRNLPAVRAGNAHSIPSTEFTWIGSPLASQALGVLWLGSILHPEIFRNVDVASYAQQFYSLFVHCDIAKDSIVALIDNTRVRTARHE